MLSGLGVLPPFAYFRHKQKRNPLVPLPPNAITILEQTTHCLVTHSPKMGDSPGESSISISGDTVYTVDVERALIELKPDVTVVTAGSASLTLEIQSLCKWMKS
jgi:hypothetical protein